MSKQYRFTIMAKVPKTNKSPSMYSNIIARNASEARNKFKASFHDCTIISCVRNEERPSPNSASQNRQNNSDSGSLGSVLLGAAATAGIGLALSFFKKNK